MEKKKLKNEIHPKISWRLRLVHQIFHHTKQIPAAPSLVLEKALARISSPSPPQHKLQLSLKSLKGRNLVTLSIHHRKQRKHDVGVVAGILNGAVYNTFRLAFLLVRRRFFNHNCTNFPGPVTDATVLIPQVPQTLQTIKHVALRHSTIAGPHGAKSKLLAAKQLQTLPIFSSAWKILAHSTEPRQHVSTRKTLPAPTPKKPSCLAGLLHRATKRQASEISSRKNTAKDLLHFSYSSQFPNVEINAQKAIQTAYVLYCPLSINLYIWKLNWKKKNQETLPENFSRKSQTRKTTPNQKNYSNKKILSPPGGKNIFRQESNFSVFFGVTGIYIFILPTTICAFKQPHIFDAIFFSMSINGKVLSTANGSRP